MLVSFLRNRERLWFKFLRSKSLWLLSKSSLWETEVNGEWPSWLWDWIWRTFEMHKYWTKYAEAIFHDHHGPRHTSHKHLCLLLDEGDRMGRRSSLTAMLSYFPGYTGQWWAQTSSLIIRKPMCPCYKWRYWFVISAYLHREILQRTIETSINKVDRFPRSQDYRC